MTSPADFEMFRKWAETSILKNDDQARALWKKISLSEDLINHFLDLPKDNQESIIVNLNMGMSPIVLGSLYRLGQDIYRMYPATFSLATLATLSVRMRFPTNASTDDFPMLKSELLDKLALVKGSDRVVAWRQIEIRVEIFELLRVIYGEDLTIEVMKACLELEIVPFPDVIVRVFEDAEGISNSPLEWMLLTH